MSGIRATCSTCGDLDLVARDLRLRLCIETEQGEVRFSCKQCKKVTVNQISGPTFDLLHAAGVQCSEWNLPTELSETPDGLVISHDEMLDFHALMDARDARL